MASIRMVQYSCTAKLECASFEYHGTSFISTQELGSDWLVSGSSEEREFLQTFPKVGDVVNCCVVLEIGEPAISKEKWVEGEKP